MLVSLTFTVDAFPNLEGRSEFHAGIATVSIEALEHDPRDESKRVTLITATVDTDPPPKAAEALRSFATGEVTRGPFEELPGSLQTFSRDTLGSLRDAIVDTFELVRWRFNIAGPPHPFSSRGAQWSEDRGEWHSFPSEIFIHTGAATIGVPLTPDRVREVDDLIAGGKHEPLAQYMLREARASATRHTVSALVMAVAAAEIGVKQLIGFAVPEAEWLVENLASPPVVRLVKEYVPSLPSVVERYERAPVPDSIADTLHKAVVRRNSASHIGEKTVPLEFLDRVIDAVGDLLRLLDFYAGNDWAIEHVDHDRLREMGLLAQRE